MRRSITTASVLGAQRSGLTFEDIISSWNIQLVNHTHFVATLWWNETRNNQAESGARHEPKLGNSPTLLTPD